MRLNGQSLQGSTTLSGREIERLRGNDPRFLDWQPKLHLFSRNHATVIPSRVST